MTEARKTGTIYQHELIGMDLKVLKAADPNYLGLEGRIVDETKNMIVIMTKRGEKMLAKKIAVFEIIDPVSKRSYIVDGTKIAHRPWDRIKKCDRIRKGRLKGGAKRRPTAHGGCNLKQNYR